MARYRLPACGCWRCRRGRGGPGRRPIARHVLLPRRRCAHCGRHRGDQPDARARQGMGDPDVRHRRQAVPVGDGARRHRAAGRGHGDLGELAASRSARWRSLAGAVAGSPPPCCPGPEARRIDIIPTLLGAVCGIAVLRLLTSGRISDGHGPPPTRRPGSTPAGGCRWWRSASSASVVLVGCRRGGVGRRLRSVSGDRDTFALPAVEVARAADPAGCQPAGVATAELHHQQRRLLPDRHRAERSPAVARGLAAAHPRDGRPRSHLQLRQICRSSSRSRRSLTLTCVSNPVGGDLISNATWTGYRVRDLLRDSGIHTRRRHGAVHVDRRIHRRHPGGGADRRPGLDARDRHERRAAARRARLSRPGWWCPVSTDTCRPPSGLSTWS